MLGSGGSSNVSSNNSSNRNGNTPAGAAAAGMADAAPAAEGPSEATAEGFVSLNVFPSGREQQQETVSGHGAQCGEHAGIQRE